MTSLRTYWPLPAMLIAGLVATTLPAMALLACAGVALVVGGMGGAWAWLVSAPGGAVDLGLRAGLLGGVLAFGLAGFSVLFGPASVIVLPALYAVAAMVLWLLQPRCS